MLSDYAHAGMMLALESTEPTTAASPSALASFSFPASLSTTSSSNGGEGLGGGGKNTVIIATIVSVLVLIIIITTVTIVLMAVLTWRKRNHKESNSPQHADGTGTSRNNNLIHGGKQYNTDDYSTQCMYLCIHVPVDLCTQILLLTWTRMLPITIEYNCSRMYAMLPHPAVWRMNQGQ